MSWVKVDDKIAFHRKIVKAGNEAFGAWMRMTAWTAGHLEDGLVPHAIAWAIVGHGRDEVINRLMEVGLLESSTDPSRDGYIVHDYHHYNPLASDVKERQKVAADKKREAGKKGGKASAALRSSKGSSKNQAPPQAESKQAPKQNPSPVPVPLFSLSLSEASSVSLSSDSDACAHVNAPELGEPENAKQKRIVDKHVTTALRVLGELNAARKRVRPSCKGIRPTYVSLGGIAARLASGRTLEECLHVIAVGEAECNRKPDSFDWFDTVTPWRPENFEKRVAMDPERRGGEQRGNYAPRAAVTEGGDVTAEWTR